MQNLYAYYRCLTFSYGGPNGPANSLPSEVVMKRPLLECRRAEMELWHFYAWRCYCRGFKPVQLQANWGDGGVSCELKTKLTERFIGTFNAGETVDAVVIIYLKIWICNSGSLLVITLRHGSACSVSKVEVKAEAAC